MSSPGFIKITITGARTTSRKLATWGARIDDLSEPMEQIGNDLLQDFSDNFVGQGSLFRPRWKQLAASTVRDRERHGYLGPHPILFRTGALYSSVAFRNAPGNIFEVTKDSVRVGSNETKAAWQHYGTSRGIPPRAIVGISFQRRSAILDRLRQYIYQQAVLQAFNSGAVGED